MPDITCTTLYVAVGTLIEKSGPRFPMRGVNGYAGEQDRSRVLLSGPHSARSRAEATKMFGEVPAYVELHWAEYTPGRGWEFTLGVWTSHNEEADWASDARKRGTHRLIFE